MSRNSAFGLVVVAVIDADVVITTFRVHALKVEACLLAAAVTSE
eukprot:COSAG06_NODE_7325_length_2546_cov_1.997548_5_plen_43_part_01